MRVLQMKRKKRSVARDILRGMRDFTRKLEAGIPIEATRVRIVQTPDGPMTIRTPTAIVPRTKP